jgi:hypothetical protein
MVSTNDAVRLGAPLQESCGEMLSAFLPNCGPIVPSSPNDVECSSMLDLLPRAAGGMN